MKALFALCYPHLGDADRKFIDEFRRKHDIPFRDVVKPHFTMIFGCSDIPLEQFREHIAAVAREQNKIAFICRFAQVVKDHFSDNYHIFLVPDEGYGEISRMHDALYRGALAPHLRLDIPYIPHIGIATMKDAARIKVLCDSLNSSPIEIRGTIDAVTVCSFDGAQITDMELLPFRRSQ